MGWLVDSPRNPLPPATTILLDAISMAVKIGRNDKEKRIKARNTFSNWHIPIVLSERQQFFSTCVALSGTAPSRMTTLTFRRRSRAAPAIGAYRIALCVLLLFIHQQLLLIPRICQDDACCYWNQTRQGMGFFIFLLHFF